MLIHLARHSDVGHGLVTLISNRLSAWKRCFALHRAKLNLRLRATVLSESLQPLVFHFCCDIGLPAPQLLVPVAARSRTRFVKELTAVDVGLHQVLMALLKDLLLLICMLQRATRL